MISLYIVNCWIFWPRMTNLIVPITRFFPTSRFIYNKSQVFVSNVTIEVMSCWTEQLVVNIYSVQVAFRRVAVNCAAKMHSFQIGIFAIELIECLAIEIIRIFEIKIVILNLKNFTFWILDLIKKCLKQCSNCGENIFRDLGNQPKMCLIYIHFTKRWIGTNRQKYQFVVN